MKEFLEKRWDGKSPLLIAYSGGPDSEALFRAALLWGRAEIHLAHVDHGWREESFKEALFLESEARRLGVPFHLKRLDRRTTEEEARELRLSFFASLREKIPYQAVLMGHHADDLAETALKRLFEGAHLTRLFGMREVSVRKGVPIWRPLLKVPKQAISIRALDDPTNRDPRYLRARMRLSLLPGLEESFGKGVRENLQLLAERSHELDAYLAKRAEKIPVKRGPFGIWIDCEGTERVELRYLLQQIHPLSRDVLETVLDWTSEKKSAEILVKNRKIAANRGHLFFFADKLPQFGEPVRLPSAGSARSGDWDIVVGEGEPSSGWQGLWERGEASVSLPGEGDYWLSLSPPGTRPDDQAPPLLRKICPRILEQKKPVGNFLRPRAGGPGKIVKIFINNNRLKTNGLF